MALISGGGFFPHRQHLLTCLKGTKGGVHCPLPDAHSYRVIPKELSNYFTHPSGIVDLERSKQNCNFQSILLQSAFEDLEKNIFIHNYVVALVTLQLSS